MSNAAEGKGTAAALARATAWMPEPRACCRPVHVRSNPQASPYGASSRRRFAPRSATAVEQAQIPPAGGRTVQHRRHEAAEAAEPEVFALGARRGFKQAIHTRIVFRWPQLPRRATMIASLLSCGCFQLQRPAGPSPHKEIRQ